MPTRVLGEYHDGATRLEIDYDASNRITAVRAIVAVGHTLSVVLRRLAGGGNTYTRTFTAGTASLTIPTGTAGRIVVTPRDRDRLDGIDMQIGAT